MTRTEALAILDEYVKNPNLKKHMLAVEAAMRSYAEKYHGNADEWGVAGLLHDFDWEIHPNAAEHPVKGQPMLESRGVSPEIRRAILTHAAHTGVRPETDMEKALFASDELSGLIVAVALVSPNKTLTEVTIERVIKKMAQKAFAANVNRDEIVEGAALLGIPLELHIGNVLVAMQQIHEKLGL